MSVEVEESDEGNASAVVTLIHGTFARGASWMKPGSAIRNCIECGVGGHVKFVPFDWTARNLFAERISAADQLAASLRRTADQHEGIPHIVVAHSHGGAVFAYVLRKSPDLLRNLAGAVFLSTPFVDARVRPSAPLVTFLSQCAFAAVLLFCSIPFLYSLVLVAMVADAPGYVLIAFEPLLWLAPLILGGSLCVKLGRGTKESEDPRAARIADSLSSARLPEGSYLILRASGDEAASALGGAQFSAWVLSKALSLIIKPLVALYANPAGRARVLIRYAVSCVFVVCVIFAAVVPLLLLSVFQAAQATTGEPIAWRAIYVAYRVVTETRFSYWWDWAALVGFICGAAVIFFVLACTLTILACWVCNLAFGRSALLTALNVEFSVDAVPLGQHQMVHTPWTRKSGLLHSSTYESDEALLTIREWVSERIGSRHSGSDCGKRRGKMCHIREVKCANFTLPVVVDTGLTHTGVP